MNKAINVLKILGLIASAIKAIFSMLKKKKAPEEVQKEEAAIKEDVKKGDVDKLNEDLGWKN